MEQALIDQDMENKRFLDSLYQEREKLTDGMKIQWQLC